MDRENDVLDALLDDDLLEPPAGFAAGVMRRVDYLPLPAQRPGWPERLQKLALLAGGVLGAAQLFGFMFSLWAASTAG